MVYYIKISAIRMKTTNRMHIGHWKSCLHHPVHTWLVMFSEKFVDSIISSKSCVILFCQQVPVHSTWSQQNDWYFPIIEQIPCRAYIFHTVRDHSQTFVRGGLMQKNQPPPPFFAMKITGQPHRKTCKLNFYWKICNFFQGPLTTIRNFKGPPFCISPPLQVLVNGPLTNSSIFFVNFVFCALLQQ